ncbi:MAG TPA: hypothetical protein VK658_27425 [Chryseolinea sp.]|nr:hypothetical protein [Chryseolinea sp.]
MRKLPIAVLLTVLLAVLSSSSFAQRRGAQRTGGARAAYGQPVDVFQSKKKAKRKSKKQKRHATKKKDAAPLNRNRTKSPWVN